MKICLCSAFRNASGYINRYFAQVAKLQERLDEQEDELYLVLCEGDSTDDTWSCMYSLTDDFNCEVFRIDHGGPDYGSIVHAGRFKQLACVWNAIWQRIPDDADAVLFVESDLIWEPATMLALLDGLVSYPAIAPKILDLKLAPDWFYDIWAFRKDGRCFRPNPPWFDDDTESPEMPVQLDSAGSVMAIRGDLARQLAWPAEDVVVGLCRQIYELGGSVWLDPTLSVRHP